MKVYKSEECGHFKPCVCEQVDNVVRDGYVSIKDQFAEFQRAGINRMQWLQKAYPSNLTEQHEKNMFDSRYELMRAEAFNQGDSLNVFDGVIQARSELLAKQIEVSQAKAQAELIKQNEINEQNEMYRKFYEENKDNVKLSKGSVKKSNKR